MIMAREGCLLKGAEIINNQRERNEGKAEHELIDI